MLATLAQEVADHRITDNLGRCADQHRAHAKPADEIGGTQLHPDVEEKHRGKYSGLGSEPAGAGAP